MKLAGEKKEESERTKNKGEGLTNAAQADEEI